MASSAALSMPDTLSALDELSSLLTCSACRGPPGPDPAKLGGCGHSLCAGCCLKDDDDSDGGDGRKAGGETAWPGGACPVAGCGAATSRCDAEPDRVRRDRWAAVERMRVAILGDEAALKEEMERAFPAKKATAKEAASPAVRTSPIVRDSPKKSARVRRTLQPDDEDGAAKRNKFFKSKAKRRASSPASSVSSRSSSSKKSKKSPALPSPGKSEVAASLASKSVVQKVVMSKQRRKRERASSVSSAGSASTSANGGRARSGSEGLEKKNARGETKLQRACIKGDLELVRDLLAQGASSNTQDYAGWTPLHEAVQAGHTEVAKVLLQEGRANPDIPGGEEKVTALHEACAAGHRGMIKLLVAHGADKAARDAKGKTPKDVSSDAAARSCLDSSRCSLSDSEQQRLAAATAAVAAAAEVQRSRVVFLPDASPQDAAVARTAAKRLGIRIESSLNADVTTVVFHGIADNTKKKKGKKEVLLAKETPAYFEALLAGKWLVTKEWLSACVEADSPVLEEDHVLHGAADVPARGAPLRSAENSLRRRLPPLFDGCHVYLQGAFSAAKSAPLGRQELARALKAGGAAVLSREPDPEAIPEDEQRVPFHACAGGDGDEGPHPLAKCSHYIIYQDGDKDIKEPELKYNMSHVKSLPVSWLLSCMRDFKLHHPPTSN